MLPVYRGVKHQYSSIFKTALFRAKKKHRQKTEKHRQDKTVLFRTKKNTEKTMLGLRFAISLKKKAEKYSTSTCISTRKK